LDLTELQHSPLEEQHLAAGGKLVPFAGWALPVQYEGILAEHRAVRTACGVFDISHMGQFVVHGPDHVDTCEWLDRMLSNHVGRLQPGDGQYSLLLNDQGGIIDDLIVYRTGESHFLLIVNAACRERDLDWMTLHAPPGMALIDRSAAYCALAVQGPDAARVFAAMFPQGPSLPPRFGIVESGAIAICRTGYTGEDGFELCAPEEVMADWWGKALAAGAKPCGLGARDLLRLEKCYPLNGSDLSEETTPWEAGLAFAVDLEKHDFIGANALRDQRTRGVERRLSALKVDGKAPPPRPGYPVYGGEADSPILGTLTSGGFSPGLDAGIAMAYLPAGQHPHGSRLWIEIRGKRYPAGVVRKPFI